MPEEKIEHMPEVGKSIPSHTHHEITGYHKFIRIKKSVSKDVSSEARLTQHGGKEMNIMPDRRDRQNSGQYLLTERI